MARPGTRTSRREPADGERALPPRLRAGLEDFLESLRVEAGCARNTLAAYRRDVESFLRWTGCGEEAGGPPAEDAPQDWSEVDSELVVDHLNALRSEGLAEASVARRLSALRMCLQHLVSDGVLERDPVALLSAPRLARSLPTTLTVDDVEALLAAPGRAAEGRGAEGRGDWIAQRDTALFEVLYACGARVSEAIGVRTDGLQPSLRVLVLHGKGGKSRIVPIGERARSAIERWLGDGRARLPGAERRPELFLTKTGRPLDRTGAWRRVKAAARAAGLPAGVSPHTLRHSFASHMIEGGADLRSVQEMLGHASIRTTEIYTHLDAEHVRGLHRLYHPRGGGVSARGSARSPG